MSVGQRRCTANSRKQPRSASLLRSLLHAGEPTHEAVPLWPVLSLLRVHSSAIGESRRLAIARGWSLDSRHYACLRVFHLPSSYPAPACIRELFPCGYNSERRGGREGGREEQGLPRFRRASRARITGLRGAIPITFSRYYMCAPISACIRALALASPGSPSPRLPSVPHPLRRRCEFTPPSTPSCHIIVYVCRACAH